MFERPEELTLLSQLARAVRARFDLQRCAVLSRLQRGRRALLWLALGAALALGSITLHEARYASVELLPPRIEHAGELFSIYRIGFAWHGIEKSCRLVVFQDSRKWSVEC